MLDVSNSYIKDHGLTFNPEESTCFMIGTNPFSSVPQWSLDGINVSLKESITFLGSVLGDGKGSGHSDSRVRNATRSFYALQGAGIKYPGVSPVISLELYRSVVCSVLEYGTTSLYINKSNINKLDKLQNRFVRQCLGLNQACHIKPVLTAASLTPTSLLVRKGTLDLLRKCVLSNSLAGTFYCKTLLPYDSYSKTLIGRALKCGLHENIDVFQYIFDAKYFERCKKKFDVSYRPRISQNGIADTVYNLMYMSNYTSHDRMLLNLLLKSF